MASEEAEVELPAEDVVALEAAAGEDLVIAVVAVDVVDHVEEEVVADAVEEVVVAVKPSSSSLTVTWESSSPVARKMLSSHSTMPPERPFTVKSESLSTTKTWQPMATPTEQLRQPPRLSTESGIPSAPSWPLPSSAVLTKFTLHPDPKFCTWEPLPEPVSLTFQTLLAP